MVFEEGLIRIGKAKFAHGTQLVDGSIDIYISRDGKTFHKNFSVDSSSKVKLNYQEKAYNLNEVIPLSNGKKFQRLETNFKII